MAASENRHAKAKVVVRSMGILFCVISGTEIVETKRRHGDRASPAAGAVSSR
jgi:hypothetical protein